MRIHKIINGLWAGESKDSEGLPPGWVACETEPQPGQAWSGGGWCQAMPGFGVPVITQDELLSEINRLCDQQMTAGYPHDFGAAGVHTLQTREEDKPNWLAVFGAAQAMILAGMGDQPLPPGIRAVDNTVLPVTALEAQAAMLGMQAHLGDILAHSWARKDAVRAAENQEDLEVVASLITKDWPE